MKQNKKRLAIQFFGHLRTYDKTYESFFENVVNINKEDYDIDIFIHTFDTINGTPATNWRHDGYNESWDKQPIDSKIQNEIISIYNPKKFSVTHLNPGEYGQYISLESVNNLRKEYEKEHNVKYDLHFYTRPDILFEEPLKINMYLSEYENNEELKAIGLPDKFVFCGSNVFQRMCVIDSRYVCEGDLIFFSNCDINTSIFHKFVPDNDIFIIQMNYRLWRDFFIVRYYGKWDVDWTEYHKARALQAKFKDVSNKYEDLLASQDNTYYKHTQTYSAKSLVTNSLQYKLGKIIEHNSNSLWEYIKLPFILSYAKKEYKDSFDASVEKSIRLDSYPDYKEALKITNDLAYSLGAAYIKADRVWYKGYLRFIFKAIQIKKRFKKS